MYYFNFLKDTEFWFGLSYKHIIIKIKRNKDIKYFTVWIMNRYNICVSLYKWNY